MDYISLQNRLTKNVLLLLIPLFISVALIIIGCTIFLNDKLYLWFSLFTVVGILGFISIIIIMIKYSTKMRKLIIEAMTKVFKEGINNETGKKVFYSEKIKISDKKLEVSFDINFFKVNNQEIKYDETVFVASFRNQAKLLSTNCTPVICIFNENIEIVLTLDKDLLNELNENGVNIINKDELMFFINETDVATKQYYRTLSFRSTQSFVMMEFKKNDSDKVRLKKKNIKEIFIWIASFVLMITLYVVILLVLNKTSKIELTKFTVANLIIRIAFSIFIILCVFFKPKESSTLEKILLGSYVVLYWTILLSLPNIYELLYSSIFAFIFIFYGYNKLPKEENFENLNRYLYVGLLLFIKIMINTFNITMEKVWIFYCISGVITLLMIIIYIIKAITNYPKYQETLPKKKYIGQVCGVSFCMAFIICILVASTLKITNIAFDFKDPVITSTQVLELEEKEDYSSPKVKVELDGKTLEIFISENLYDELEIGDSVEVYRYYGAFNSNYYKVELAK